MKSDRGHAHRFSPHYHSHASRRVGHPPRQFNRHDSESGVEPPHSAERPYDSSAEQHNDGSRHNSMDYHRRVSLSSPTQATPPHQDPLTAPLLRVLYPNLTLTLALIYVDRLKAVSILPIFFLVVCSVAAHCELWAMIFVHVILVHEHIYS